MSRSTATAITGMILVLLGLCGHAVSFLQTPVRPPGKVYLEIPPRTSAWDISRMLEDRGVITDGPTFMAVAILKGRAKRFQAGIYVFEGERTPMEVMNDIFTGKTLRHRLTIPEGSTIFQIADLVSRAGTVSRKEFITAAMDPDNAAFFGIDAPSLEGFLFPDTYFLPPRATPLEVIARMVDRFTKVYSPEMARRADQLGMTKLEVVTLASLIEKEAKNRDEKPLISSVFHNRLRKGMRLQSDPTAVYGIDGFSRKIEPADLTRPTPYNTYLHKGLPPGPICNPGADALRAALWPASSDFLYFYARGDGSHVFSRTLHEHNKAITSSAGSTTRRG